MSIPVMMTEGLRTETMAGLPRQAREPCELALGNTSDPVVTRLEAALLRLEGLIAERDAEIARLRHVQVAAAATLVELDAYLDDTDAAGASLRGACATAAAVA